MSAPSMELNWARELFRPTNRDAVEEVERLVIAVEQFGDLINDSRGVVGLHLNGDEASWDELLGTWLDGFRDALAVTERLRESYKVRIEQRAAWSNQDSAKARGETA